MKQNICQISAVDRYTAVLKNSRKAKLPPGYPLPQPPATWPAENVALFERYLAWLIADGAGHTCIMTYYLPVAGHVLGYQLQPHEQLDLDTDLEQVMAYLRAKQLGERWLVMGRHALTRFRRFMQAERGLTSQLVVFKQVDVSGYHEGLPHWLVEQISQFQHLRQANWRPARLHEAIGRFWNVHTRLWRWLLAHYPIQEIGDIKRAHVYAYMDERLAAGYSAKGLNQELRAFQATLCFLQERDFAVPQALLRLSGLKEPDTLPRFLTDEQVGRLRDDLERQVQGARTAASQRNALLDRAAFYLLWQGGLRLGEVEELRLDNLNLAHGQLVIRQGKGCKDRAVYLTDKAVTALQSYLTVRGDGPTDNVFLYRHRPLHKDFIRDRIKAVGERTGVKVTPHQLRHTFATQLVNAGCRITTIQALLGHKRIDTTLTYARVHDRTVAEDYFAAMAIVEKRLEPHLYPAGEPPSPAAPTDLTDSTNHLLTLVTTLQTEPLTTSQQTTLTSLQHGLTALAKALNGTAGKPLDHIVNEPTPRTPPLAEAQPP